MDVVMRVTSLEEQGCGRETETFLPSGPSISNMQRGPLLQKSLVPLSPAISLYGAFHVPSACYSKHPQALSY